LSGLTFSTVDHILCIAKKLWTIQRPNHIRQLLYFAPNPRHGMVIVHFEHRPALRVEVRFGLLDTQMQKRIAQPMDM